MNAMEEMISNKKQVYIGKKEIYESVVSKYFNASAFMDICSSKEALLKSIEENGYQIILIGREDNYLGNQLLWEQDGIEGICIIDGDDPYAIEKKKPKMMNKRIWDFIAVNAQSEIEAGGWRNSYDLEAFSEKEMEEYVEDVYMKLKDYADRGKTALEIGCASGLTMFRMAPCFGQYIGTDMAKVNIEKNRAAIEESGIENIRLIQCEANEIGKLGLKNIDIVIINSVCQYFPGINYLRSVIEQALQMLGTDGVIYLGDVMDLEKKGELEESLVAYKNMYPEKKTKTDWSEELFLKRSFFCHLGETLPQIVKIEVSDKIATIENELTRYRYDVILHVSKGEGKLPLPVEQQYKWQYAVVL